MISCRLNNNYEEQQVIDKTISGHITNLKIPLPSKNATTHDLMNSNTTDGFIGINVSIYSPHLASAKCDPQPNSQFPLSHFSSNSTIRGVLAVNETNSSDTFLSNCLTTPLIDHLIVISHLLLAINSSANVIIYLFIGK